MHPETQAKGTHCLAFSLLYFIIIVSSDSHYVGDKDPLDVVEIGEEVGFTGQIKQVKVLGVLAMIDEGETDWKVICIDVKDPHAAEVNGTFPFLRLQILYISF